MYGNGALKPNDSAASGSRLGCDYECGGLCLVHAGEIDKRMMALAFFAVGVVSAWAIGMLSRGWLSQNSRTRMWLIFAAASALVGSAAGMVKELVETLNF